MLLLGAYSAHFAARVGGGKKESVEHVMAVEGQECGKDGPKWAIHQPSGSRRTLNMLPARPKRYTGTSVYGCSVALHELEVLSGN